MDPLTSLQLDPQAPLRRAVARLEAALAQAGSSAEASAAWTELRAVLRLTDAPELRACPRCDVVIMRAATRCGHCWTAVV